MSWSTATSSITTRFIQKPMKLVAILLFVTCSSTISASNDAAGMILWPRRRRRSLRRETNKVWSIFGDHCYMLKNHRESTFKVWRWLLTQNIWTPYQIDCRLNHCETDISVHDHALQVKIGWSCNHCNRNNNLAVVGTQSSHPKEPSYAQNCLEQNKPLA